jgi:hypothetical protein
VRRTALALALLLALGGCGTDDAPAPDETSTSTPTSEARGGAATVDGTRDDPTVVEPTEALLDWNDSPYAAASLAVRGEERWGVVASDRSAAFVTDPADGGDGDDEDNGINAGSGRTISELLMSEDWAVVVKQDEAETAPSQVVAIDLATDEQRDLVSPPAASGGSWALTGGDLYFPTYGDGRAYCLATVALADANGEDGWCAPARSGFSGLTASADGVGMMTFDDARPVACRTLNLLDGSGVPQPVEGPTDCLGWDVAATPDGVVWSEVPKPRRQEEAHLYASVDGAYADLGPGTTGSVVPCGDSVFFARDPQGPDEPARLMRWTPAHTLEVAYESASVGNAFLGEPVCGGGVLTLTSFGEKGDEQVWASVS